MKDFRQILSTLPLLGLAHGSTTPINPKLIFEERDGLVAIEAEHFTAQQKTEKRSWHIVTRDKAPDIKPDGDPSHAEDASGGAYLEILPDTRRSHADKLIAGENFTNKPGEMAVLSYPVHFTNPGRYYCWVRTHSTNTEDNGIHLGIDNTWPESGARMQWTTKNAWHWDCKQRTTKVHTGVFGQIWVDVAKPGMHLIQFSMREDGFEFDKFILSTAKPDAKTPPAGKGASSRGWGCKLPLPFGKPTTIANKRRPAFPAHWGKPPRIQKKDIVDLPKPYGRGSSTLKKWILEKLAADKAKKGKKTTLKLNASDIPAKGGFYLDQGKWLAIHPDKNKQAQTDAAFPYPAGKYNLTLLGVGENDGKASHEILSNGESILKFTIPLSTEIFETGEKFNKTVENLTLNPGDVLTLKSKVASADGKEFSRARMAGLVFTPADDATTAAVAKMDKKPVVKKSALPDLQQPRKADGDGSATVTGANTQWQPVTLTIDGPFAHELDQKPNPFRDLSLFVNFTHSSGAPSYTVPGYFAADGNAAETSAQSGTKWRAHFSPDLPGDWNYKAVFLLGEDVSLYDIETLTKSKMILPKKDSASGKITIAPAPKDAPGFYNDGRLTYVGKHYLQFAGSKHYFLKAGADAPETLLAYQDFDGTIARKKNVPLKAYAKHLQDWKQGDPTWKGGKGKGLIGALNYLSGKGMNAFSFLPYNAGGDGDNVWPFTSRDNKFSYDCSKLDQWNIVFSHAQAKGLFLHFKLQETEMDDNNRGHDNDKRAKYGNVPTSLDGGDLGPERKLYCREIIARFGHHLALNWNLGEENTQTTKQQMDMANYVRSVDPYDHHLVIHTYPSQQDKVYKPLLKTEPFTGISLQNSGLKDVHWQTVKWHRESAKAGKPWCIAFDEPGTAHWGMPADPGYPGMPAVGKDYKGPSIHDTRKQVLWGNLMGGGWGVEYYFGYKLPENDLVCEDWRSRDKSWDYARHALNFFREQNIPFADMKPADYLIGNIKNDNLGYCLTGKKVTLVYLPDGGNAQLQLPKTDKARTIQFYNPRTGVLRFHSNWKTAPNITAPGKEDWLAIIRTK